MGGEMRVVKDPIYRYSEHGDLEYGELAESSKSYIWELENKNPPRPSADKVAKIAAVLGVTADYLIDTTEKVGVEDATDNAFFRKYRKMDAVTKDKIRRMADLLGDDE
jgi:transcriptional regulator with XRE-family HTH domain